MLTLHSHPFTLYVNAEAQLYPFFVFNLNIDLIDLTYLNLLDLFELHDLHFPSVKFVQIFVLAINRPFLNLFS